MNPAALSVVLIGVFGAVCGSFLNVVIYRLPRGLSIARPYWSFCPCCEARIPWYDNVPIIGWLLLRGRCRNCVAPISVHYPIVEALTALAFVTIWDLLFVSQLVSLGGPPEVHWVMAGAYFTLYAGLLACAVMDIESYSIDIRISLLVLVIGVVSHGSRGLDPAFGGQLPPALSLAGIAAGLTGLVGWLIFRAIVTRRHRESASALQETPSGADGADGSSLVGDENPEASDVAVQEPARFVSLVLLMVVLFGVVLWQALAADWPGDWRIPAGGFRFGVFLFVCMTVLILASWRGEAAEAEVMDDIETGRSTARREALRECLWLAPALAVGVAVFVGLRSAGVAERGWEGLLGRSWISPVAAPHLVGAVYSVGGMVWAVALGWAVRVLGTLAFGKEAFGTGDIYLMASIGAVAGFWNLVFGFFFAALLALVGVLATLFRRRSRAIPFGPWLALGSVVALGFERALLKYFSPAGSLAWRWLSGE